MATFPSGVLTYVTVNIHFLLPPHTPPQPALGFLVGRVITGNFIMINPLHAVALYNSVQHTLTIVLLGGSTTAFELAKH